jgi:hypothetical protein
MTVTRRRFLTHVAAAGGASLAYEGMTALGLLAAPAYLRGLGALDEKGRYQGSSRRGADAPLALRELIGRRRKGARAVTRA